MGDLNFPSYGEKTDKPTCCCRSSCEHPLCSSHVLHRSCRHLPPESCSPHHRILKMRVMHMFKGLVRWPKKTRVCIYRQPLFVSKGELLLLLLFSSFFFFSFFFLLFSFSFSSYSSQRFSYRHKIQSIECVAAESKLENVQLEHD